MVEWWNEEWWNSGREKSVREKRENETRGSDERRGKTKEISMREREREIDSPLFEYGSSCKYTLLYKKAV